MKKTILVTGARGYIASYIQNSNKDKFNWIKMTRDDTDFSNPDEVEKFVKSQEFDICLHTAANATTAVCEENPELAANINVESTKRIVDACKEKGARLIFCSTEQIFNGKENHGPFKEDEEPKAVTVYGQNKIDCEKYINDSGVDAVILRFSWMMGLSFAGVKASPSIVKNVLNAIMYQKPTLFTCNERRCMTYAKHLAEQFYKIVELPAGIYHVASSNDMTTYESACFVAREMGITEENIEKYILPNTERYSDRFRDYRLDSSKLEEMGIKFGDFKSDVREVLKDFSLSK